MQCCKCRFLSLRQMFEDLNRGPDHTAVNQRQPVILLLGGGMAAGKSTVREIIGRDGFWSKVRASGSFFGQAPRVSVTMSGVLTRFSSVLRSARTRW